MAALMALVYSAAAVVTAMLVGLKLDGLVRFSWWLATAPLWGTTSTLFVGVILLFLVGLLLQHRGRPTQVVAR